MKKYILGVLSVALLASCQSEEATEANSKTNTETENVTTEEIADSHSEGTEETADQNNSPDLANLTLEEYADLKTREDVVEVFGTENIENGASWYGEGSSRFPHSIVTNPANGHVVKYLWEDVDSNSLNFIEVSYKIYDENYEVIKTQEVPTNSGIYTGMPIKELAEWNDGEVIEFAGFGWDFHGNVYGTSGGGKIHDSGLSLSMDEVDGSFNAEYAGDVTLSTADEAVLNADIVVGTITKF